MTPYHPAVVHLPIALVTLSVVAEVLGRVTGRPGLRAAAWYALLGAVLGAAVAVPLGLWDMSRFHETMSETAHARVEWHMRVGYTLLTVLAGLTLWRWLAFTRSSRAPGTGYLTVALLALGLTFYQGWLGGELVFKHGVAVTAPKTSGGDGHGHGAAGTGGEAPGHGENSGSKGGATPGEDGGHSHEQGTRSNE